LLLPAVVAVPADRFGFRAIDVATNALKYHLSVVTDHWPQGHRTVASRGDRGRSKLLPIAIKLGADRERLLCEREGVPSRHDHHRSHA
jgi:hypothetical protein